MFKKKDKRFSAAFPRRTSSSTISVPSAEAEDVSQGVSFDVATAATSPNRRRAATVNSSSVSQDMLPPALQKKTPTKLPRQKSFSRITSPQTVKKKSSAPSSEGLTSLFPPADDDAKSPRNKPLPATPLVTSATASELVEMLPAPGLAKSPFRQQFFYALPYIVEPMALLDKIFGKLNGSLKEEWTRVLYSWVEEHFYYFSSSQQLMTSLLQRIDQQKDWGENSSRLHQVVEAKTARMISAKSRFRTTQDVELLKAVLRDFVQREVSLTDFTFAHEEGVALLSKSAVLLASLDLDAGISSDLFLRNSATNVMKRLVEGKFLVERGEEKYALTSSSVAIFHQLVLERKKEQQMTNLRTLLAELKRKVGLQTLKDDTGVEYMGCMTGRSMVECMIESPETVPKDMWDEEAGVSEKRALRLGKMLMDENLIIDNTSGAFNMFSSTHLYSLPLELNLEALKRVSSSSSFFEPELMSLERSAVRSPGDNRSSAASPTISPTPTARDSVPNEPVESLCGYDARNIARCIYVLDLEFLSKLDLTELDFTGWKKGGRSLTEWITYFNRISFLVATEIITCPVPDDRKALLEKFVDVAAILLELRDFQALFAVVAGLSLNCVARLTDVWERGVDSKHMQTFGKLQQLTGSRNNFKEYRAALVDSEEPTIPYLGLLLQDILSIEEVPQYVSSADPEAKVINFERLAKLGQGKHLLKMAQDACPPANAELDNLCEYLNSKGVALDSNTLYLLSLKIHSRNKKKKK